MTPEIIQTVLDLGLPGLLLIAVWALWVDNRKLRDMLIADRTKAEEDRKEILAHVQELKFWSGYKGDDPPGDWREPPHNKG